jgi:hypothetical protein
MPFQITRRRIVWLAVVVVVATVSYAIVVLIPWSIGPCGEDNGVESYSPDGKHLVSLSGHVLRIGLTELVLPAAAVTPAQRCESKKNQIAGKYSECRQKAEGKLAVDGDGAAYAAALARCQATYDDKWTKAEAAAVGAGGACQTTGARCPKRPEEPILEGRRAVPRPFGGCGADRGGAGRRALRIGCGVPRASS